MQASIRIVGAGAKAWNVKGDIGCRECTRINFIICRIERFVCGAAAKLDEKSDVGDVDGELHGKPLT